MSNDPALSLAAHIHRTRFADLPAATVTATKRDLLDTFGCLLGGTAEPGIAELTNLALRWGGLEESSVVFLDRRLPAPQAAALHGSMAHALDYDDVLDHGGSIHPGASVLAACMAVADLRPETTGRDVILAVALGLDVSCRIALASTLDRGWHRTAVIGIFGAAAAAAKLLGLDESQTLNALGIAYSQAAGNRQCILDGALTKRLQAGQAAAAGVQSAILAQTGFTGARDIFAGRYGFFELYQPGGYELAPLTSNLGIAFRGDELSFKPYPCGRPQHAALDAAIALHRQLGLDRDRPVTVEVTTGTNTWQDQFAAGVKRRPTQIVEAQFALPFLIAAALAKGRVGIGEVAGIGDPAVLDLAARIDGGPEPSWLPGRLRIAVRTESGRSATQEAEQPSGSPERPLSDAELAAKFRDCAANASRPIAAATVDSAIAAILDLDNRTSAALVPLIV
ncbi:MmgE/PrpD family protein [Bradyrhizobium sp. LHD-71]|uniref:MmgE/PrpD family protein n=1 Tax=Bradyrhizobium sp. LHD-71 TaxID=3072141 RepID=UPI00280C92B7|nr:MmgE/PrpD family protein [Bradyrhizobium sp. LHD-71]MDQ8728187.1 MmgE/PrpD family protein [Bradyrhizobium sp. LHD-71]